MPLTDDERESYRSRFNHVAVAVIQGELIEITYVQHRKELRFPGKRKQVSEFTKSARLRMLKSVAKVDWSRVGRSLFITLTYPDDKCDRRPCDRNRDKYLFTRSMENYLGRKVGVLWRIEWVPRKSGSRIGSMECHVHLIVFDCRFLPIENVRCWWRSALRAVGPIVVWIDKIEGGRDVGKYIAKYCGKISEGNRSLVYASYLNTGRHWGIQRRGLIPWCERTVTRLTEKRHIRLAENAACMTFPYFTRDVQQGFSLFGKNAVKVIAEICRTDLDDRLEAGYNP